ncbi:diguanylate cyclase [Sulfurimonas sp. SAG-AH-194-C21]|nr:diguanylate cyclase [Sulfurimonas sp. SAG-AH-194-C21]MDF1883390.1 diguanylate cyclase [Sulfurimonas sp. SAG-AH-194-C21]
MSYKGIKILYVEHEVETRNQITKFLNSFCNELYVAKNGLEALILYEKNEIDIIITAIVMPDMNGIELVEIIKKKNIKQLVIFTSQEKDSKFLLRAIELEVDGYITKPINLDKLKFRVQKCISQIESKKALLRLKESEEKFRIIAQTAQMGILIYKEKIIYVNDALCKIIGYSREELLEMYPWELAKKEQQEIFKELARRRVNGKVFSANYSNVNFLNKDGVVLTCRASANTIEYEGGYAGLSSLIDITDVVNTKEHLHLLAQAMEQMDEMVRITDKNGCITYVNKALIKHTTYLKEELIGQSNSLFKSGKHSDSFYKTLWETVLAKKTFQAVFMNRKKDGELYYEDQTITPILDKNNEIKHFVSTSQDVTERIKMQEKLTTLATIDTLTDIYNRYKINLIIEEEISRVNRYGGSFALLMFDLDYFKRVNDTYGHDVGDYVLQEFSKIISESIRDTDKFGRWGGEEFILLSPEVSEAGVLGEKLRNLLAEHTFKDVGQITVSIGISLYDTKKNKEELLKEVDKALYAAKAEGRNRVVFA